MTSKLMWPECLKKEKKKMKTKEEPKKPTYFDW